MKTCRRWELESRGGCAGRDCAIQHQSSQQRSGDGANRKGGPAGNAGVASDGFRRKLSLQRTQTLRLRVSGESRAFWFKEGRQVKKGDRLLLQENIQASGDVQAQAASINSAEAGVEAAEASYRAAQADLLLQASEPREGQAGLGNEAKVYSRTA